MARPMPRVPPIMTASVPREVKIDNCAKSILRRIAGVANFLHRYRALYVKRTHTTGHDEDLKKF